VSRKIHSTAGTFDINLPLTGPRGVECRNRGATGAAGVDHKLIFTFANPVASCGTAGQKPRLILSDKTWSQQKFP
jgi:hypothetical protein